MCDFYDILQRDDMIINAGRSLAFVALHENLTEKFRKSDNLLEMIDFLKVFEVNFDV